MNREQLYTKILEKNSYLCIGLDTDIKKIPSHLLKEKDPVFEFNRYIIEATYKYCVAYKPNIAFYESLGARGWESLQKTLEIIPKDIFTIADAKRGDIGNTSSLYARTFFDKDSSGLEFDAVTVAPYMGEDSVKPFLDYKDKWAIVLALTSNEGSKDFQMLPGKEEELYIQVIKKTSQWGSPDQIMFVVGATKASYFAKIRALVPDNFFLVPGVGAQGGNLLEVSKFGMNRQCGLLINSSRNIIYASYQKDFSIASRRTAEKIQEEMKYCLEKFL